jgi:hypothetical protein
MVDVYGDWLAGIVARAAIALRAVMMPDALAHFLPRANGPRDPGPPCQPPLEVLSLFES